MPSPVRTAQALGITTSACLAGACASISFLATPPLFLAPEPLIARQWKKIFDRGMVTAPPLALASATTFGFLSYRFYNTLNQPKAEMYALSALLTIGIIPYTILLMSPTNQKLLDKEEETRALSIEEMVKEVEHSEGESTKKLLDRWATHNLIRSVFPLTGAVLGLWTSLTLQAS